MTLSSLCSPRTHPRTERKENDSTQQKGIPRAWRDGAVRAGLCGDQRSPPQPIERRKRINLKVSLEDNLITEFLQPKPLPLKVGAAKPFTALHFSDTHVSMMDAADILSGKVKELSLYEARNHGLFGRGGFPFAVQSLAATLAYAKRKNIPLLNTGDLFDFRSEANIAFAFDAAGVRTLNASDAVDFALEGPGEILGAGNGDACEYVPLTQPTGHRLFGGCATAVVRRTGSGPLTLKASSPSLGSASVRLP